MRARSTTTKTPLPSSALRVTRFARTLVAAAAALSLVAATALAQTPADKPRVPPGVDPGGVAVAIIGDGIDYTRPEIAARLARDGEGQIFGWDFIDADRRPFAICAGGASSAQACPTNAASTIVRLAPTVRLIVVRASPSRPQSLVEAMLLVRQSPARIVLVSFDTQQEMVTHFLLDAANRFPDLLFYAAEANIPRSDQSAVKPANLFVAEDPQELIARAVTAPPPPPVIGGKAR